jgi:hypothetical protein
MSDTFLRIIPTNPSYVPDEIRQGKARNILQKLFDREDAEFETTAEVEFVDQGQNFESVHCNRCGQEIGPEDWQNAMNASYETKFENLIFRTPCCCTETSLNDLDYRWPAGFSRFSISIQNPQTVIDELTIKELENAIGAPLRIIWAPL